MAILNKIRQRSLFLIIIIALALFSFVLADVFRNGGFDAGKQNTIATVNGEEISREAFARQVEQQTRFQGPNASTTRAVNSVYNQEVNRVLLEEQYEALGIKVSNERLQELLKQNLENDTRFQDADGFFSNARMQEFIATLKNSNDPTMYNQWLDFEKSLITQEKQSIYYNLIKAGVGATLKDGELAYMVEGNSVDIQYVQIPYASVSNEEVTVSKEEIAAYIKDHASEFQTEATRNISYVMFEEKPSLEDENEMREELMRLNEQRIVFNGATKINDTLAGFATTPTVADFVNENSDIAYVDRYYFKKQLPKAHEDTLINLPVGAVYGPYKDGMYYRLDRVMDTKMMADSLKTNHILIDYQGAERSQATRTKEAAKKLADSLFAVVKNSDAKFTEMAAAFSADTSNKDKGGALGWFGPTDGFAQEYKDFVINNSVGTMDVVETIFGFHIIDIVDKRNVQRAVKLASLAKEIEPSEKTISEVYNTTQKFEIAASSGDFNKIAKDGGYAVMPVTGIQPMDENLPGAGTQRPIVQWAFDEDTEVGAIKRFQVNQGYIVAKVTDAQKKGLMSTENASFRVTPILRNKKKAEKIIASISGNTLDAIATNQNQTVKTAGALNMTSPTIAGAGNEPLVVGRAFGLNEGQMSQPIEGANGVYVITVTKKTEVPALDNYAAFAQQQAQKTRGTVNAQVINALKEAAEIEDYRATFY